MNTGYSRRWAIFAVTSSLFFLSQFYRASNAVIAPQLTRDLNLDTQALGTLSAAYFYAFALTQIPVGILLDRLGPRRLMTALSVVGVLGALVFSLADSLALGLLGRVLLGVGTACNLMGTFKLLTVWFGPLRFATLTGLVFSLGTVGNMTATTPLVLLVQGVGWRITFQGIAGINLLLTAVLFIVVRDRPGETASVSPYPEEVPARKGLRGVFGDLGRLFRDRSYWVISLGTLVSYGVFAAFQTLWAGPFLMEVMGCSALHAGNLIFLFSLGLILGGPGLGALSDRVFRTRKWMVLCGHVLLTFITFTLAGLSPGRGLELLALLFFAFGLFRGTGFLMYPHIKELMPIEMAGAAMTGINFFTMIGPALFLHGLGAMMQHLYPHASRGPEAFRAAFFLCALCLAFVSLLYLLTRDPGCGSEETSQQADR
ncbi:MAG: MFS transporter [Deltaproteobacteria bacterium]|nr:MFS transporter [Deltaproteobacteria bacterium]